jgi:hypothetical protein
MNALPLGGWKDVLNSERMNMEIVEGLQTCIADNAMQRMRGRENSGKSSRDSETSPRKAAADRYKRPKRMKV